MKTVTKLQAALAALVLTVGCGGGGSLPLEPEPAPGPTPPDTGGPAAPAPQSLWPLTRDSTWTYDITDDLEGRFTKTVTVKGPGEVPGQPGTQAIQVESVQVNTFGTYVELSWQQETGGLVSRLREEDRRNGNLVRTTVWSPATLKMISQLRELNWSHTQGAVTERIAKGDGSVTEEMEKPYVWTVKGVNETVSVPAGTFDNALRLERTRADQPDSLRIYWLVPGVGKVKEDGTDRLEELRSYSVQP